MKTFYDLTTKENIQEIQQILIRTNPTLWVGMKIVEKAMDLFNPKDLIEEQKKTAVEIIKEGKKSNVDELELELFQEAGVDVQALVKEMGLDGKIKIGKSGNMKIKVKYK